MMSASREDHRLIFEHITNDGYTVMNFGDFTVHSDGSATAKMADGTGEVKLSPSSEWQVVPKDVAEGMKP